MLMSSRQPYIAAVMALALLGSTQRVNADVAERCPRPAASIATIAALFERWNALLATGDPGQVAKLYAEDAVLLPTPSDKARVGRTDIGTYFADFLRVHPQTTVTKRVVNIDCASAADDGVFVYRVTGQRKGTRWLIGGRYNLRYEYRNGEWLIVHHRISGMHQPLSLVGGMTAATAEAR